MGGAAVGAGFAGGAAFEGLAFWAVAVATGAFLAEDGAGFAAEVFLTTGGDAGLALTAGLFTVAGSFDELERAFTGVSSLEAAAVLRPRGPSDKSPAGGEPRGYTLEADRNARIPVQKSHPISFGDRCGFATGARLYIDIKPPGFALRCAACQLPRLESPC
ncbi:hypothetical protein EAH83_08025 [Variovorax ginsengisoli]|uniref:Uncharacterized protein n=1 Tax=Variovorax guangxiensis TaxID=1775474 RepID=A0A502DVL0_9BURK|nr:hypothetical protein EAH83_08025 [Variovorax ginsengisoli]TPG28669.1 hypothetical protein EAH82_07685 [Variovorax guangxiensis]